MNSADIVMENYRLLLASSPIDQVLQISDNTLVISCQYCALWENINEYSTIVCFDCLIEQVSGIFAIDL